MTPQNAFKPSRIRLSLSSEASEAVYDGCKSSYLEGFEAFIAGKERRKYDPKAPVFGHSAWLAGWDDAKACTRAPGERVAHPQGAAPVSRRGARSLVHK